jgi:hypothetical protein
VGIPAAPIEGDLEVHHEGNVVVRCLGDGSDEQL